MDAVTELSGARALGTDQAPVANPFVLMVKPVGHRCNLACSYCYYLKGGASYTDDASNSARMSNDVLEAFISQYLQASSGSVASFTWHGGEPTLAGLDFYQRAVALQKQYLPESTTCWNNLQTNGLLLDDQWCEFLAHEHFDVGVSIDGTQWVHDSYRQTLAGTGSHAGAVSAVARLQAFGVNADLLCTVSSASAKEPLAVYRALRAMNTHWIQFIPIVERDETGSLRAESVDPHAYGEFLSAVFYEWALNDLGHTDVQLFAEMMRVWAGGQSSLCWMMPTCGRALIVEKDGAVYSCDHFVDPEHRIGSVTDKHLASLVELPEQHEFGNSKQSTLPAECLACEWLSVCNGGCPKDRFALDGKQEPKMNYLCEGLKAFFSYAKPYVDKIAEMIGRGAEPAAIMQALRASEVEKWQGIGRNDPCPCGSNRKAKNCCWSKRP